MKDGQISVDCFTGSLIDSATIELADNISGLFSLNGAEVKQAGFFPGWQPDPNSDVLTRIVRVYQQLNGTRPEVKIIHAALECGILSAAKPGVDMISFGPQIENPHTPSERVRIDSVDRFWSLLKATITELASFHCSRSASNTSPPVGIKRSTDTSGVRAIALVNPS